jgi:hypothetical protein
MQPRIRIIKRGAEANPTDLATNRIEKTDQVRERETANTVKSWVAEWEARNRALKTAAVSLLRSLEDSRRNSAQRLGVVNG